MALHIFNTLTGKKEPLQPRNPPRVTAYICGVTVYDLCHVGHARAYVSFDVAVRFMRRRGYDVKVIRNFTDVDDKIIARANKDGVPAADVSEKFIKEFNVDMGALKVQPVTVEPKVTTHMPQIVALVQKLVERGSAYVVDGVGGAKDVYYSVDSFPTYLKLSGRSKEDLQAGARVEVDERKKDPLDFALWKSAKPGEPSWDSPWGKGRPGWHIECSAMCLEHAGPTVDIHAGGRDLIFPHHENEIAQSEPVNGAPLATLWMHNGFVNIDNEKMSKSLGNFFTIRDVLQRVSPDALRYFLLTTPYRGPINFADTLLDDAERRVETLYESRRRAAEYVLQNAPEDGPGYREVVKGTKAEGMLGAGIGNLFDEAMDDDFNSARALGVLADAVRFANTLMDGKESELLGKKLPPKTRARLVRGIWEELAGIIAVLGVVDEDPAGYLDRLRARRCARHGIDATWVEQRIAARAEAKARKDFAAADAVRAELAAKNVVLKDSATGTRWSVEDRVAG
ncbi:MAG: cysteine--tRNA ligase [Deltaproteobacteria bacterium]|nr:cysteine--tRNA ligase [Deltaproteobacteria bacterium]